ncbi:MAG: amidase [Bryobacteraceae bacterium]
MTRRGLLAGFLSQAGAPTALHQLDIAAASRLIALRKISPVELTRACLARIEERNPRLNAFITVTAESALAEAKKLAAEKPRGPLHGIPIALKDLYDTAGVRTTAASRHFEDRVPTRDAAVVAALRNAGAVILGKLNMDEFAFNFTSETSFFGKIHNPWKHGYTPGGSSGGSAAALAAGLCLGALGSDTGGSIRLPAALCGVSGFKPAYGALRADGVLPLAWSLDHPGPMARTPEDCRLIAAAMGLPQLAPPKLLRQLRIGLPLDPYWSKLDPEAATLTRTVVDALGRLCAGHREVTLPSIPRAADSAAFPEAYSTVIFAEAFAFHQDRMRARPNDFHPGTRATIALGGPIPAAVYIRARRALEDLRARSGELFENASLLVMPTAPGPAFPMNGSGDLIFLRNTAPWNLYGLPAISVPCGFTKSGLPVGLQLVAPRNGTATLFAAAAACQSITGAVPLAPA